MSRDMCGLNDYVNRNSCIDPYNDPYSRGSRICRDSERYGGHTVEIITQESRGNIVCSINYRGQDNRVTASQEMFSRCITLCEPEIDFQETIGDIVVHFKVRRSGRVSIRNIRPRLYMGVDPAMNLRQELATLEKKKAKEFLEDIAEAEKPKDKLKRFKKLKGFNKSFKKENIKASLFKKFLYPKKWETKTSVKMSNGTVVEREGYEPYFKNFMKEIFN